MDINTMKVCYLVFEYNLINILCLFSRSMSALKIGIVEEMKTSMSLLHNLQSIIKILKPEDHHRNSCPPKICHSGIRVELKESINFLDYHSRQRKITYNELVTVRNQIKKSCSKFKSAGTHIKEWFDNLIMKVLHLQELHEDSLERNILVEYNSEDSFKRNKKSKYLKHIVQDDHVNKDLSPFLTLHPLREGIFCAEITLDHFPTVGDIMICVSGYKLEICTLKRKIAKRGANKITRHIKCGEINLPIYIDPKSLRILVDDSKLTLIAHIKGCLPIHKIPTSPAVKKMKIPRNTTMWYIENTTVH